MVAKIYTLKYRVYSVQLPRPIFFFFSYTVICVHSEFSVFVSALRTRGVYSDFLGTWLRAASTVHRASWFLRLPCALCAGGVPLPLSRDPGASGSGEPETRDSPVCESLPETRDRERMGGAVRDKKCY